jgi:hypothetical protein
MVPAVFDVSPHSREKDSRFVRSPTQTLLEYSHAYALQVSGQIFLLKSAN